MKLTGDVTFLNIVLVLVDFFALLVTTFIIGLGWWGLINIEFSYPILLSNILCSMGLFVAYYWFFTKIIVIKLNKDENNI